MQINFYFCHYEYLSINWYKLKIRSTVWCPIDIVFIIIQLFHITITKTFQIINGTQDGAVGGASVAGPIDEDLFDDEDLDELEEDLENLEVW